MNVIVAHKNPGSFKWSDDNKSNSLGTVTCDKDYKDEGKGCGQ